MIPAAENWPPHWPPGLIAEMPTFEIKWSQAGGAPSPRLLRLSVLRELSRAIHAGRSAVMAGAAGRSMSELQKLERAVDTLRGLDPLDRPWRETLLGEPAVRTNSNYPVQLKMSQRVGAGKLERSDRQWELALAREAETSGYSLHALEATVPMREVEGWSHGLDRAFWPRAIVLFTESGATPSEVPSSWTGRWWACVEPRAQVNDLIEAAGLCPKPRVVT